MDQNTPGLKYEVYSILLETFKKILSQKAQFKNSKIMDVQRSVCISRKNQKYVTRHRSFSNYPLTNKSWPFNGRERCK